MKNLKYIKLLTVALLCGFFSACDDMLDESPKVDLTDDALWNSPADFAMGTNGLYDFLPKIMDKTDLPSNDYKRVNYISGIMHRDVDADLISNWVGSTTVSSSTLGNEDGTNRNRYRTFYAHARRANFILERAEKFSDQEAIKQYTGECYFFRAFASYLFFRDFGPGIIVKTVLDTDAAELNGTQAERLDFFNWMMEDLTMAESLLTPAGNLQTADIGRITVEAAQALKARLYLFEASWQKYHYNNNPKGEDGKSFFRLAADYSKKVIDSNQFELFRKESMGDESYRWMFILESSTQCNPYNILKKDNKEYILRNRFDENIKRSNSNTSHTAAAYFASRKMVEMYLDKNGLPITHANSIFKGYGDWDSFIQDRDPRLASCVSYIGQQTWGYGANGRVNWTGNEEDVKTQSFTTGSKASFGNRKWITERNMAMYEDGFDVPVIRLAEMYLTYAEALCEANGGTISDADLDYSLNKVRARVNMPALTNGFVNTNGLNMLEEIRRERTVEFYLEGLRLDDLRRWKTAETEMSMNIEGFPYTYKGQPTIFATTSHKFQLKDKDGNVILNDRGRPFAEFTYRKLTTATEEAYPDGSSYVVFEKGEARKFGKHNYYSPVPREELVLNPNLKPSPGWE